MMNLRYFVSCIALAVSLLTGVTNYAAAQSVPSVPSVPDDWTPKYFDQVSTDSGKIEPFLYNGERITWAEMERVWPATVRSEFRGEDGRVYSCTSSFIGPLVAITAAHCVARNGAATFVLRGRSYPASCTIPAAYPADEKMDIALCIFSDRVPMEKFERISLDPGTAVKAGNPILLTGFGCTDVAMNRYDRYFGVGHATVDRESSAADSDLLVKGDLAPGGRAILCPGDSGGGAYRTVGPDGQISRILIGINSRTSTSAGQLAGTSYIVPTYAPPVASFISAFLKQRQLTQFVCIDGNSNDQVDCQ